MIYDVDRRGGKPLAVLDAPAECYIDLASMKRAAEAVSLDVENITFAALDQFASGIWRGGTIVAALQEERKSREYHAEGLY